MKSPFLQFTRFALCVAQLVLTAFAISNLHAEAPSEIANISSRLLAERGDDVIVTEFAVQGTGTEYMLLRSLGPSLRLIGLRGVLRNPTMSLLNERGRLLDSNDDWVNSPDKDAILATGLAPMDDLEPAIVHTFEPGIYTVVVRGEQRGTGLALPEVYRLSTSDETTTISGIGTRGFVSIEENVLLGGVILTGTSSLSVLIRALGPSLTAAGIKRALPDPVLELYNADGTLLALNDNWRDSQEAEIEATGLAPGDDLESAILVNLVPGAYTAVLKGLNDVTGTGFVQFYSLATPGPELDPAPIIKPRR